MIRKAAKMRNARLLFRRGESHFPRVKARPLLRSILSWEGQKNGPSNGNE